MSRPIITLTTDFGAGSPYVGQMKGVILSLNPDVTIIDITHSIPPHDIHQGAIVLSDVTHLFPPETVHVAVVDPGVGTERQILYVRIGNQQYIAPDNGLLSLLIRKTTPSLQLALTNRRYWREQISATFHGRDIMAPAAAHLTLGVEPQQLGEPIEKLERLSLPEVHVADRRIRGTVVSFDSFGNLITDITSDMLEPARKSRSLRIQCGPHVVSHLVPTYGAGNPHEVVALVGSSGMLELAVVRGNAARRLGIEVGEEVTVSW